MGERHCSGNRFGFVNNEAGLTAAGDVMDGLALPSFLPNE
jgi:hypothetical protein